MERRGSERSEIWATALWVENHHENVGPAFIADKIKRLALEGDFAGVSTGRAIAERYDMLVDGLACADRQ
ncbi:MAG: hypothetical protein EOP13_01130 [Pseudomonas sp.]|nr:MAG: hypothetical protein EOP13_01130 [Pseudomonas sp.]